ncbi:MAG: tRNA (guanosine(37)-N1)-methyltransferase TrmD [Clostridia bacterium]|nr:tRNA (guanosine(37)-N1)-methyltransferase TrmD [Clostridia bacterium]
MRIKVLTLFPEAYEGLTVGILDKAIKGGKFNLDLYQIRDYSLDKHKKVDDAPFGGGAGMLMTPQPIYDAMQAADPEHKCRRIYLSPRGATLTQEKVVALSKEEDLLFLSGSYEGVDQRVIDLCIDEEISIGDYVLTSGDLPCMVTINAISRYVEGVLGSEESTDEESFASGLLEYPQYTRPQEFMGLKVPEVLVGGNHGEVAKWRREQQLEITRRLRPDLIKEEKK